MAMFILILQFLWLHIEDLAGKGLGWKIISELLLYASAGLVPLALPLAILVASIMTFGNLGENFELTAIKSSGIPLQKFMRPLMVLTITISIGAFFYSNYVVPYTNLKAYSLMDDISHKRQELQIREGIFYDEIQGYTLKVGKKKPYSNLMLDIMIYDHTDERGNTQVTVADSGYIKMTEDKSKLLIILFNGQTYKEMKEARGRRSKRVYPHQIHKFNKQTLLIDITGFSFKRSDESMFSDNYKMLNMKQLRFYGDSLRKRYNKKAQNLSNEIKKVSIYKADKIKHPSEQLKRREKANRKKSKPELINKRTGDTLKEIDTKTKPKIKPDTENKTKLLKKENKKIKPENEFQVMKYFNSLSPRQKQDVLSYALRYARKGSREVSTNKQRFERKEKKIFKHYIEWHEKITLSLACLIFFFIGAPLGSIIRKGGLGTPLVLSVILFIVYYIISISGENFVEKGVLHPIVGMWISSLIFFPIGVFLTYKATNDSVILNPDTYINKIKKILTLHFKKKSSEQDEKEDS
jgi:lipopolysaccharide export system permease protein